MRLVVSIGNPLKADDNIGNLILDKLTADVEKIMAETNPEAFIDKMKKFEKIYFIDAVDFEEPPGTVRLFSLDDIKDLLYATHNIPISMLKKMLPDSEIKVIGIQPRKVDYGTDLSEELQEKFETIIEKVNKLLQ